MPMIGQSPASEENAEGLQAGNSTVPESGDSQEPAGPSHGAEAPLDPTRYGDWEKNGRCIDF